MISILNSYNNGGYVEFRPRLFRLLNLLISKNFKSHVSLIFEQAQAKVADELLSVWCFIFNAVYCFRDTISHWHYTAVFSTDFEHG